MTMLFDKIEDARSLAQIVVETVREPLLVLDNTLKILVASNSFHKSFQINPKDTPNKSLFALDNGAWDIPALHDAAGAFPGGPDGGGRISGRAGFSAHRPAHLSCCMPARCWAPMTAMLLSCWALRTSPSGGRSKREKERSPAPHRRSSPAEGNAAGGDAASHRQQPPDHRQHPDAQGARRDLGGNPPASAGRASPRHVGRRRAAASARLRPRRYDGDRALSVETLRFAGGIHDRRKPPSHPYGDGRSGVLCCRPMPSAWA